MIAASFPRRARSPISGEEVARRFIKNLKRPLRKQDFILRPGLVPVLLAIFRVTPGGGGDIQGATGTGTD